MALLDELANVLRGTNPEAFAAAARTPQFLAITILTYGKDTLLELYSKFGHDISKEQAGPIFYKLGYPIILQSCIEVVLINSGTTKTKQELIEQVIAESGGSLTNEDEVRVALSLKAIYQ